MGGGVFISSILLNIPLLGIQMYFSIGPGVHSYVNPLVISSAFGLMGWFSNLNMQPNRIINYIAKSCFAVFLLHHAPAIGKYIFKPTITHLYDAYSGIECILIIFTVLTLIFIIAIILDIPRKFLWNKIASAHFRK